MFGCSLHARQAVRFFPGLWHVVARDFDLCVDLCHKRHPESRVPAVYALDQSIARNSYVLPFLRTCVSLMRDRPEEVINAPTSHSETQGLDSVGGLSTGVPAEPEATQSRLSDS